MTTWNHNNKSPLCFWFGILIKHFVHITLGTKIRRWFFPNWAMPRSSPRCGLAVGSSSAEGSPASSPPLRSNPQSKRGESRSAQSVVAAFQSVFRAWVCHTHKPVTQGGLHGSGVLISQFELTVTHKRPDSDLKTISEATHPITHFCAATHKDDPNGKPWKILVQRFIVLITLYDIPFLVNLRTSLFALDVPSFEREDDDLFCRPALITSR